MLGRNVTAFMKRLARDREGHDARLDRKHRARWRWLLSKHNATIEGHNLALSMGVSTAERGRDR
jgi:hypothetical protein